MNKRKWAVVEQVNADKTRTIIAKFLANGDAWNYASDIASVYAKNGSVNVVQIIATYTDNYVFHFDC